MSFSLFRNKATGRRSHDVTASMTQSRMFRLFALLWWSAIAAGAAHASAVLHVDGAVPTSGDGLSWGGAMKTIPEALAVATSGTQVWVAAGDYPTTISIPSGIAIYGGFRGIEADLSERDLETSQTVITGWSLPTGFAGHLVTLNSVSDVRLDGVVVAYAGSSGNGGGIYCKGLGEHCVIANCGVISNLCGYGALGGGLYCEGSSIALQNVDFIRNGNTSRGGNAYFANSNVTADGVRFSLGTATTGGGGLASDGSTLDFTRCLFVGNEATTSTAMMTYGGAMDVKLTVATMVNSVFESNNAPVGSAISGDPGTSVTLINCTLRDPHTVSLVSAGVISIWSATFG